MLDLNHVMRKVMNSNLLPADKGLITTKQRPEHKAFLIRVQSWAKTFTMCLIRKLALPEAFYSTLSCI